MKTKALRVFAVVLLLALLTGLASIALAEGTAAVVKAEAMKVYGVNAPHRFLGTLARGTAVTVEKHNGSIALVRYNGYTGLALLSDLKAAETGAAPVQTTEASSRPVIAIRDTKVYAQPTTASSAQTIQAGTALNLLAVSGNVAKVERGGQTGYMRLDHLGEPGSAVQKSETKTETPVIQWDKSVVTNCATRIYAQASASSAGWDVAQGMQLTLVASRGNIAMVERCGKTGYMLLSHLSDAQSVATQTSPAQTVSHVVQKDYSGTSNKELIYRFLTGNMGLSHAAACGVMANIKYESGYSPVCTGDGNTSYGIVQWHASRKSAMISWCEEHNLDYTTLPAQLLYFQYELDSKYPSVESYLRGVENSPQGAYDAGYHFCYYYEAPSNRASKSETRGAYARDTLY